MPDFEGDQPAIAAWISIDNAITAKVKQKLRDLMFSPVSAVPNFNDD
jgi:hypothetical protein